jgi:hypothetical protein
MVITALEEPEPVVDMILVEDGPAPAGGVPATTGEATSTGGGEPAAPQKRGDFWYILLGGAVLFGLLQACIAISRSPSTHEPPKDLSPYKPPEDLSPYGGLSPSQEREIMEGLRQQMEAARQAKRLTDEYEKARQAGR